MFVSLFPQSILSLNMSDSFDYGDELFAILGIFSFINYYSRQIVWKQDKRIKTIFSLLAIIVIIGWISTMKYKFQEDIIVNLLDSFSLVKLFFIFFLSIRILHKCDLTKILYIIFCIVRFYIVVGSIFCLINLFIDIGMSEEYRFGIRNFRFINSNSGDYASILLIALAILHLYTAKFGKGCYILRILTLLCLLSTLRGKAIGTAVTYVILILFIKYYSNISLKSLVALSMFGILGGYFQIKFYFLDNVTARSLLLLNGITTANTYFPLGAGFSTYGSNMAKVHYSSLYTFYGFSEVYGMSEEEPLFLNDNFWPMIMGQFGWFSLLIYFLILLTLFKIVSKSIEGKQLKIAGFIIFFLLVYSSVGGPIFLHYIGCVAIQTFAMMMALAYKNKLGYV